MAALPYMQLYVADYLADTMHLTTEEHGAYLLLIMNYWQTGKPIPKNRLSKIARMDNDRWTTVEVSLSEFFNDTGTEWVHDRIERDLEAVKDAQEQRVRAGRASAEARKRSKQEGNKRKGNDRSTTVDDSLQRDGNEKPTNKDTDTDTEVDTDTEGKKHTSRDSSLSGAVNEVFSYWCTAMGKNSLTKLTKDRRGKIEARLKEGYNVDHIKQAIDGCTRSPHHMGTNDAGTVYDDLTLICRSGSKLEWFAKNVGAKEATRRGDPETIDDFAERNRRQAERVMASGMLDDLPPERD
jgi:uncharacterized protein YdaU (DUF1376 family)